MVRGGTHESEVLGLDEEEVGDDRVADVGDLQKTRKTDDVLVFLRARRRRMKEYKK